ncbi:MAG: hypothetical protein O2887_05250 [Bacteroidetes bacterium]|nr:hypothetical protein [Bacteroidota bacterium]MDA1119888.1 hypothetical protein [Bacteroidota bacterium]
MRRIAQILTIALILFSTIGVSVTKHYCGNILRSTAINTEPNCGADEMPEGCCHNETENFSIKDDFQLQAFDFKLNPPFASDVIDIFEVSGFRLDYYLGFENSQLTLRSHPPSESDIYIRIQSFLI